VSFSSNEPWTKSWRRTGRSLIQGRQGRSFVGERIDGSGEQAFIKTLKQKRNERSRKRFRREVTTYETLDVPGLPRLIEHNANSWRDKNISLYMVQELIIGQTLGQFIESYGPMSSVDGRDCIVAIASILKACHQQEVTHRDLKPHNVILQNGNPRTPYLVDFGLSFNQIDSVADVTNDGEEVGNRFLRLPEHSWGGRSPISDVTQLAGLFLYTLTGYSPRVLIDADGKPPHRRDEPQELLSASFSKKQLLRLESLFDKSFTQPIDCRFQSVDDFTQRLDFVFTSDPEETTYTGLLARAREITQRPKQVSQAEIDSSLRLFVMKARQSIRETVSTASLLVTETGFKVEVGIHEPYARIGFGVGARGSDPPPTRECRFEWRGIDNIVCSVDGTEIWRGSSPENETLSDCLRNAALEGFLRDQGES
jgi:eukaryotic-like serine/threonine-protein kinase